MSGSDEVLHSLIRVCKDIELFSQDTIVSMDDDLFDYGVIDSMGLTLLGSIIEETYGVLITSELFIAELRTPRAIAEYIAANRHQEFVAL